MTTTTTIDRTVATANGTAPIPFYFQAASKDEVAVLRNGLIQSPATYTVQLNGDETGTVTPLSSWSTDPIIVYSNPLFTQPFNWDRFTPFYPDQFVPALDRLARYIVQIKGRLDRTAPDATLRTDLATASGAAMVGKAGGGSVQDLLNRLGSETFGVLASGTFIPLELTKIFTGAPDGATDFRGLLMQARIEGANGAQQVHSYHAQTEVRHTAGTVTFARGMEGYVRLGLLGSANGNLTAARVFEGHVANESAGGKITSATVFFANQVDLGDGAGLIDTMTGFYCGDQGHATRIGVETRGFHVGNFTAGAPRSYGYGSDMSYGAGRWGLRFAGGASNYLAGRLRIGGPAPSDLLAGQPNDFLEVVGGIRAQTSGGTIASIGFSGTGTGGAAVQATNKAAGVTLNSKPCGQITMNAAALAANTLVAFTFTNDQIGPDDHLDVWVKSGNASIGSYLVWAEGNANGARTICVLNRTGGSLSEALVLGFEVRKATIA